MHILTEALRQYRHNDSDEFVMGYDKEIIDQAFDELEAQLAAVNELPTFKRPKAADSYVDLKKQFNGLVMMLESKERQIKLYRDKDYAAAHETALTASSEISGLRNVNEQLTNDIDRLEQERDQLKAQNVLLVEAGVDLSSEIQQWLNQDEDNAEAEALLSFWHEACRHPTACLAAHNASLILDEMYYLSKITASDTAEEGINLACNTLERRADKLLQKYQHPNSTS